MFGIGWTELALTAIVAVVVIGPKDLPHVLYSIGKFLRKIKKISADIQLSLDGVMREGELEDITREANKPGGENLQFEIERQLVEEQRQNTTKAINQQTGTDG